MYKLIKDKFTNEINVVQRLSDGACIPFDSANTDYANFKKELVNGAELQDADGKVIDGLVYLATLDKEQQ
jgi:hypothetical protein